MNKQLDYLDWIVRPIISNEELEEVAQLRFKAYSRHIDNLPPSFGLPEEADHQSDTVVFVARHKATNQLLGTVRIQHDHQQPLALSKVLELPTHLQQATKAEGTRLAVEPGRYAQGVKISLMKALVLWSLEHQVEHLIATARDELVRMYSAIFFTDIFNQDFKMNLPYVANLPHRILSMPVGKILSSPQAQCHPLFNYFVNVHHPDIQLDLNQYEEEYLKIA